MAALGYKKLMLELL